METSGRGPAELALELERLEHGPSQVLGERHLGACLDVFGEHLEARVRVDAAHAGLRDRLPALERKAGRVREQVANGRPGRPGRLVEVDDALLDGDQDREGDHRLRHRRPSELLAFVATPPITPSWLMTPAAAFSAPHSSICSRTAFTMGLHCRGAMSECDARTQGAAVSTRYGRD